MINRRNFTCPSSEDIAIFVGLVVDPASTQIAMFDIFVRSTCPSFQAPPNLAGGLASLIPSLASLIKSILDLRRLRDVPSTQFYVFSSTEHAALQRHIIDTALTETSPEALADVRLCVGTLCEGAALLATSFQPVVLSGALLDFLGRRGARNKSELKLCLERLGLSSAGTIDQLRARVIAEIDRVKVEGGRANQGKGELGHLPRVVVLQNQLERLVALPIPGYWDLKECSQMMVPQGEVPECPTEEQIFLLYRAGDSLMAHTRLRRRNRNALAVLMRLRLLVRSGPGKPMQLVNEARALSAEFMDICRQEQLRKLFFMQQFEVLAKLSELWRSRIDGCPEAPVLEYRTTIRPPSGKGAWEHHFYLVSGSLEIPADKERTYYDWLLAEDKDDSATSESPAEALFDDIAVAGMVFPLTRYTRSTWEGQHSRVQAEVQVADVRDTHVEGNRTLVVLYAWGSLGARFRVGTYYRLSPRLVDFNVTKVLSTLLELDLRTDLAEDEHVPYVQLISAPRTFAASTEGAIGSRDSVLRVEGIIQRTFRELSSLGSEAAGALLLKHSQQLAARRILTNRLAVIWGPPGTGKTYTIALSLLRILDVRWRLDESRRTTIFLTAMTHAAIKACLSKLDKLVQCYRQIEGLPCQWLDTLNIEYVLRAGDHPGPNTRHPASYVYAGTVFQVRQTSTIDHNHGSHGFQLYNFAKKYKLLADYVVIDEAGQLGLGPSSLVLRSLADDGSVVIAGDSEQLAPILTAQYPRLKTPLFGSVLDCLMQLSRNAKLLGGEHSFSSTGSRTPAVDSRDTSFTMSHGTSQESTVIQLTENFR